MASRFPYPIACYAAIVVIVFFILVSTTVSIRGHQSFTLAETSLQNDMVQTAISQYEKSIRWYLPFNGRVENSIMSLWQIGQQAEKTQDMKAAAEIYQRLRSSLYAIRSFYQPFPEWIGKVDRKLESIANPTPHPLGQITHPPGQITHPSQGISSKGQSLPHAGWAFSVQIGFWGWIVAILGLCMNGFGGPSRPAGHARLYWIAMIAICYALWLYSLSKA